MGCKRGLRTFACFLFSITAVCSHSLYAQGVPATRADSVLQKFHADTARWHSHIDSIYNELRLMDERREEARQNVLRSLESLRQTLDSLIHLRKVPVYGLMLESDSIDLGSVRNGQRLRFFIRFQNTGNFYGYILVRGTMASTSAIRFFRKMDPVYKDNWGYVELKYKIPHRRSGLLREEVTLLFHPDELKRTVPVIAHIQPRK